MKIFQKFMKIFHKRKQKNVDEKLKIVYNNITKL